MQVSSIRNSCISLIQRKQKQLPQFNPAQAETAALAVAYGAPGSAGHQASPASCTMITCPHFASSPQGREIIANLSKAAGLASMIAAMRPDIDNIDE